MQVTFTEPVVVTGTPGLRITLGRTGLQPGDGRWVPYESGSGTAALIFRLHRAGRGFNGRRRGQR